MRAAQQELGGARERLTRMEAIHAKLGAMRTDLDDKVRALERWELLNQLIGSADGQKFRKYAQQVTLVRLVALANEKLQELSVRYVLEMA